jgi:iduronate 2-sulfatase
MVRRLQLAQRLLKTYPIHFANQGQGMITMTTRSTRNHLASTIALVFLFLVHFQPAIMAGFPNVLFIPIDDLRPDLGAYGNQVIQTPHMDRLAKKGITFTRAYCQQAVCNPSRASLLSGMRPDFLQVWDLKTKFRDNRPDVVTLPQFFKNNDYTTIGLGKTYHNVIPDPLSWTEKPLLPEFPFDPDAVYLNPINLKIQQDKIENLKAAGRSTIDQLGHWYVKAEAIEIGDTKDDDDYFDGAQTTRAIHILETLKTDKKPFFLSVGYYRPHLPFNAPKKYWDLYQRDQIPLAKNQYPPKDSPPYAVHGDVELRSYIDCHDLPLPEEAPWDVERQRELLHGYYASISYVDTQVGRLMDALERLGLADNTVVVLWGDHGWKLGEHNGWCKQSNYEIDTRVPLIVSGAGVAAKGKQSNALVEFVDIYPTLVELAGFEVPEALHGKSFVPLLRQPDLSWKEAAYSQFLLGRFGKVERISGEIMGYTVRTDKYRYVEWYQWNEDGQKTGDLLSQELFDHTNDPDENINLAAKPGLEKQMTYLNTLLRNNFKQARPLTNR